MNPFGGPRHCAAVDGSHHHLRRGMGRAWAELIVGGLAVMPVATTAAMPPETNWRQMQMTEACATNASEPCSMDLPAAPAPGAPREPAQPLTPARATSPTPRPGSDYPYGTGGGGGVKGKGGEGKGGGGKGKGKGGAGRGGIADLRRSVQDEYDREKREECGCVCAAH